MFELVKRFWLNISFLGIQESRNFSNDELKNRVFFNQCIFVGFFSLILTTIAVYPFIGNYALINNFSNLALIVALFAQIKGHFAIAKRLVVYSLFAVGLTLTSLSGGDFLYHTGIITVLTFAWVMFSHKTELIELLLFCALAILGFLIGELNLFNAPDFTAHPDTKSVRIVNLIGYSAITLIFISFIKRLNSQNEQNLILTVNEKEQLIKEVKLKTLELEKESVILEEQIAKRTAELLIQKKKLETQNTEKEVLLKEIHHRVKNNLQIIVSLLNLEASRFEDKKILDAINETQNRIISMSLVHQRMYQTADFVAVEFSEYTHLLFENIETLYSNIDLKVKLKTKIPTNLSLDIETAIPLGLIINELITNTFKHAFPTSFANKEIQISITELEKNSYYLEYTDNGTGLPIDFELKSSDSLGFQLITALIDQINGQLSYFNDNGAVFEINFAIK